MYKQNQISSGQGQLQAQNRPNSSNQQGKIDIQQKFSHLNSLMKNNEQDSKKDQAPMRPYSGQVSASQSSQILKKDDFKQDNSSSDANKILQEQVAFMKKILDQTQKINMQQVQTDELNKNILESTLQLGEDTRKSGILQEQMNHIKIQIQQAGDVQKERLEQQKVAFDQQIEQLEQQLQEKDQQIEQTAKEYEGYNMEEIQTTMEKLQSENQMRDQIIKELQDKLEEGPQQQSNQKGKSQNKPQSNDNVNKAKQSLQMKQEEIQKLEELIENFKTLYQHMNDEKQILVEENEQLSNENNQFREIFSQNLHLFGIDPNLLNEGQDGQQPEEQDDVEIIDENEDDDQ